jgi:hypothetical protein
MTMTMVSFQELPADTLACVGKTHFCKQILAHTHTCVPLPFHVYCVHDLSGRCAPRTFSHTSHTHIFWAFLSWECQNRFPSHKTTSDVFSDNAFLCRHGRISHIRRDEMAKKQNQFSIKWFIDNNLSIRHDITYSKYVQSNLHQMVSLRLPPFHQTCHPHQTFPQHQNHHYQSKM